jgi:outer membrane lipase/esterase
MVSVKPAQFEPKELASRSRVVSILVHRQGRQCRGRNPLSLGTLSVFVIALTFGMVTAIQAQDNLSTIPGLAPPEQATADTIRIVCGQLRRPQEDGKLTGATDDLTSRCRNLVSNGDSQKNLPETRDALRDISPDKIPTQGTTQVEAARVQAANIGARLAALRGGATGLSLQGLSFNIKGNHLPGTMLASLLPTSESRPVASAGEPSIFGRFGTSVQGQTSPQALDGLLAQRQSTGAAGGTQPSPFGRLGIFANGTFTLGDKDATSSEAGFDFDTLGVTAGLDYRFTDNFVLGAAFGFASTDADINSSGGSVDANQYSGSIFATYYLERFYIDGIASVGRTSFDSIRNINYLFSCVEPALQGQPAPCISNSSGGMRTGPNEEIINQTAKGDTDGTHFSLGTGAGYDFGRGGFTFGPYGRINYLKQYIDGYSERIDNTSPGFGLPLAFGDQDIDSLTTALGVQGSYAISTGLGVFVPQVLFEWIHEFLDDQRAIVARYVHDPNNVPLSISTEHPDRNYFNLGFGVSGVFRRGTSAFLYYQTALGLENITKHDIVLGVRLAF